MKPSWNDAEDTAEMANRFMCQLLFVAIQHQGSRFVGDVLAEALKETESSK